MPKETFVEFFERHTHASWKPVAYSQISDHMKAIAEATAAWNDKLAQDQEERLARIERAVFPLD